MNIREVLDKLDEISRRDFLKGAGAAAAGAALSSMPKRAQAMTSANCQPPSIQDQIRNAVRSGAVPQGNRYSAQVRAGWVYVVYVDNKTYDISHQIPQCGKQTMKAAEEIGRLMGN